MSAEHLGSQKHNQEWHDIENACMLALVRREQRVAHLIKQGHVGEQENALSELVISGSTADSLNCSSVAIFI